MSRAQVILTDVELERLKDANCALSLIDVLQEALVDAAEGRPWSNYHFGAIVCGLKTVQDQMLGLTERIVMDGYKQLDEAKAGGRDDG